MKFCNQKTEIQKAITLNFKKNFYRTLIVKKTGLISYRISAYFVFNTKHSKQCPKLIILSDNNNLI